VFHAPFLMPFFGAVDNKNRIFHRSKTMSLPAGNFRAGRWNFGSGRRRKGRESFSLMQPRQKNPRLMVNTSQFLKTFIAHG